MKNIVKLAGLSILILSSILLSCKKEEVPVITTTIITNITATSATSGGNITDEGTSTVIARGVCWSINPTPTIADNKTSDDAGAGSFSSNIDSLVGGTSYFIRAYATNNAGTGYGMALSFKTTGDPPGAPMAIIGIATNLQTNGATLNGTINANYLSTIITFEYGTTTSYGGSTTATQNPATGNTNTNVNVNIIGLTEGTTYHYRIKAVNSLGTTYSSDMTFTTLGQAPIVITLAPTNITTVSAQLNGTVNANSLPTIVTFEYGLTGSYGNTINATQSPLTGSTDIDVSVNISSLSVETAYHYRVKAVNSLGTTYGNDFIFSTPHGNVIDVEGNTYNVVEIGGQIWMAENLKTTKYRNGDTIPNVTDNTAWTALSTPAYCWMNNDEASFKNTYGALYNWYVVQTNNLCPTGWHVPTDAEWTTLSTYLGGESIAGGKLKETGTTHWNQPNLGASNSSGFTALPSGQRLPSDGSFTGIGSSCSWWSSTQYNIYKPYYRSVAANNETFFRGYGTPNEVGVSIRCIKDN